MSWCSVPTGAALYCFKQKSQVVWVKPGGMFDSHNWNIISCWHLTVKRFHIKICISSFSWETGRPHLTTFRWRWVAAASFIWHKASSICHTPHHSLWSKHPRQAFGFVCPCVMVLGMGFVWHQTTWVWIPFLPWNKLCDLEQVTFPLRASASS